MPPAASNNPVQVIQTTDWLASCRKQLDRLNIEQPLIVSSAGGYQRLELAKCFPQASHFHDIAPNPTLKSCEAAIAFSQANTFDGVVTIGGGSVLDTAKCILAARATGETRIKELIRTDAPYTDRQPAIFIPTTHGTGSEVTMWGTVWDLKAERKYSLSHPALYPDVALLDAQLTLSLPLDISLITTLDALSHSFEAIWNKQTNQMSTDLAVKAIVQILENAPRLKAQPDHVATRENLLSAATTAGLAFSSTRTAAAHSISYPLTIHFGIPHGIAASLAIVPLLKINGPAIQETLDTLYMKLDLTGMEQLSGIIQEIPRAVLKYRLSDWGVSHDQLPGLVDQCFTKGRMNNNIVDLTEKQVSGILEEIF